MYYMWNAVYSGFKSDKESKDKPKADIHNTMHVNPCAVVEGVLQRWQLEVEAAVCVKACIWAEHAKGKLVPTNEIRYWWTLSLMHENQIQQLHMRTELLNCGMIRVFLEWHPSSH